MCLEWLKDDGIVFAATATATAVIAAYGIYRLWKYWSARDEYFQWIKNSDRPTRTKLVLVIGLDGSGKTCFLKSFGEPERLCSQPSPTVGVNAATRTIGNVEYTLYEVGASGGIVNARSSWSGILKSLRIQTVVMVIDSSDHERINHAKVALAQFSEENKTTNIQLLILANKQDVPGALSCQQVKNKVLDPKYQYKKVEVIGTTLGPMKERSGVSKAYDFLSSC